jgi:hypothetical protein
MFSMSTRVRRLITILAAATLTTFSVVSHSTASAPEGPDSPTEAQLMNGDWPW